MTTLSIIATLLLFNYSAFGFQSPPRSTTGNRFHPSAAALKLSQDAEAASENNNADAFLSRRRLFGQTISSAVTASLVLTNPSISSAKVVATPLANSGITSESTPERDALLQALTNKSSNEVILQAIDRLVPLSPLNDSTDKAAYASAALDGEWKLMWYSTSNFSPLLKLPSPFRPDSYQYFGSIAEREVGEGRVAQGLVGGVLSPLGPKAELWLSSGAVAQEGHPSSLEIFPPFRFQVGETPGSTESKKTIVEADSDAEFRKVNSRSTEAQLAPKNVYEQLYVENFGSGSLRVSKITSGDPVIVGEMFIHQKL